MGNLVKKETGGLSLKITLEELLQNYSPRACIKSLKGVNTVELALIQKTPTIGSLSRNLGEHKIEAYLKVWIINLNESINCTRPLKEHQIDECAELIVDQFKNISIADINIIFKRAKTGYYGELYETLSINKILNWFKEYFEERCQTAAKISRRESKQHKVNDKEDLPGWTKERVSQMLEAVSGSKQINKEFDEEKYKEIKNQFISGKLQEGIEKRGADKGNKKIKPKNRRKAKHNKGRKRISRTTCSYTSNSRRVSKRKRD